MRMNNNFARLFELAEKQGRLNPNEKIKEDTTNDFRPGIHDYICPFCGVSHDNDICRFSNLYSMEPRS